MKYSKEMIQEADIGKEQAYDMGYDRGYESQSLVEALNVENPFWDSTMSELIESYEVGLTRGFAQKVVDVAVAIGEKHNGNLH